MEDFWGPFCPQPTRSSGTCSSGRPKNISGIVNKFIQDPHRTPAERSPSMPRSKRAKVVHLSKVEKKGREHTLKTFANVQASVAQYPYMYVFSVDNMRNTYLKDVRSQLADSR